ncbi:protein-Npi-phosphohistidine-sugar phosphotransferase [Acididesulfobacillus acetoxydans]|uniref:Permease IIC component n=1 Tax=Acididesulfobacillus acetoxydans TaxID=1561005 RepID=A0A8S0XD14_9FIRM|nr:PTS transporter subunit EIIC [Acididesulfobacillus acetoxydans]CAA7603026.1 protein-Npi-phosphohistidine-sugar phosphotransferase [Acididesulfobacillus acetoxydans]CEJ08985.1 Lichenan permease IIC component [Acididesulfobacillus acetoxydans]
MKSNRFMQWMDEHFMPVLAKIAQNIYLQSIRDAFCIFALPLIITGSVFLIISNPPVALHWGIITAWNNAITPIQPQILIAFNLSFGIMALMVAFGTAYSLASRWDLDDVMAGILSMVSFLIVSFPATDITKVAFGDVLNYLGGEGLFVAILLGIMTAKIMKFFGEKGLVIKMPAGVPPYVVRTFTALVPFFFMITFSWALEWAVWAHFHITLPQLVLEIFKPLVAASDSYPAAAAEIVLMMLLWSLGIHGMNVVSSVAYPFWMTQLAANDAALKAGRPLPGIVTEPFFHMFTHIGGSGLTWPLTIMFLLSASKQLKAIGKTEIVPAIFNINEPIIFGAPLVLNPIMFIPFILAPLAAVTINYAAFAFNLVPRIVTQPSFTTPVFLGGIIATGGYWQGAALQAVNLVVAALIYYPFFKMYEKELVTNEKAAEEEAATALAG